jgi:S-adenosylmethionine-diacylgycerolhomoserine-N-methlytransferase
VRRGTLREDLLVLRQFAIGLRGDGDHAARLEAFYGPQAARYDAFRERLLHGRAELLARLAPQAGSHLVELGAGTGRNVEFLGERARELDLTLVDLCPSLLAVALRRHADANNVNVVEADATRWQPARAADCVLLSYALTMMPDWRGVLDNAHRMLAPGGSIAVVDFHVSAARPPPGRQRHGRLARAFWPRWFGHDGVRLDSAHLDVLTARFETRHLSEHSARLPWLPGLRAPYYLYIGRRRAGT